MNYLIQFQFQKDKQSHYWLPLFLESENKDDATKVAKETYTVLKNTFSKVNNYSIDLFHEKALDNNILKDYIKDERVGEYEILNLHQEIKIQKLNDNTDREITFAEDVLLKQYDKKDISYLDVKKNSILTRKISDNINNFEQYLVVKLKRKAAIIMDPKKNPKADLERLRGTLLLGGLIFSFLLVYALINYKFYDIQASELGQLIVEEEEEDIIPITEQNTPPPPPPPPPPPAPEILEIVEDDVEIEDEIEIDTEADAETVVEAFEVEEEVEEDEIFTVVETQASFPGGTEKLFKYLNDHIKYPPAAKANDITGRVFVNFVVGKDGTIRDIKILRGVHELLDKEAIRVVKSFPKWSPGKQRGKPVSVSFNLPINFVLK